jgi:hypothetical protein
MFGCLFSFGCNQSTKSLVGGYRLERFAENGKYYLENAEAELNGGGVFDGTVEEIGWNQDWIVARITRLASTDTNGWYALDLKTKQVIGPIGEADLKTNSILGKIECHGSAEVFSQ